MTRLGVSRRRAILLAAVAGVAALLTALASNIIGRTNAHEVAGGASSLATSVRHSSPLVVFVNVTVLPMDRQTALANQTVVVRDGRIASIGLDSLAPVPLDALRIDGRGKFLMPGLVEMHAHVQGPQAPNSEEMNRDIMFLYVANGVTTIRAMLGAPNQLVLREQLKRGDVLGPTMYVAAPSLNGQSAPTAETAARLVRSHKQAGYDLLKIHPGLTRPAYDAIVRTAREVGITWAGHVGAQVGIDHVLATKQSTVDHLDGYIEGAASAELKQQLALPNPDVSLPDIWRSVTDESIRELARNTRQAGVWNIPTMFLWESFFGIGSPEEWARREEMKYAPKQWVSSWMSQKRNRIRQDFQAGISPADAALHIQLRRKMLKALADEGAMLLMGTDSPQMFNVPGFALRRELNVAIEAGLTPFQILEAGTRNVGRYVASDLKQDGNFGTVTVGNRADLVLLNANPLQRLSNLDDRAGVMVRGRWVPRTEIDRGLEVLAAKYAR